MKEVGGAGGSQRTTRPSRDLVRVLNDRIQQLDETASFRSILCECADPACRTRLHVTREEYEHVRATDGRFMVAPGHERPETEIVVEAGQRYSVVEPALRHG